MEPVSLRAAAAGVAGSPQRCLVPSRVLGLPPRSWVPSEEPVTLRHRKAGCWFPSGAPFPLRTARRALAPRVPLPRDPRRRGGPRWDQGGAAAPVPPPPPTRDEVIGEAAEIEARRRRREQRRSPGWAGPDRDRPGRARRAMTERCSLWSALSAAACCFYRGSFMQVQVSGDAEDAGDSAAPRTDPAGATGEGGGVHQEGEAPRAQAHPRRAAAPA